MKSLTLFTALTLISMGMSATTCLADYADLQQQIPTELEVWVGGYGQDTDFTATDGLAAGYSLPEDTGRTGSHKAAEFYSMESSPSVGVLFKSAPLPHRTHLELDFFSASDWYGDFRYSYLDNVMIRLLPRRIRHNIDNLTLYDFDGAGTGKAEVENLNPLDDDYGFDIDINQWYFRLKTPGYAIHLYSKGEIITRTGEQQLRFLGGSGWFTDMTRISETHEIDEQKIDVSVGATAHLGPIEIELLEQARSFKSNSGTSVHTYDYSGITTGNNEDHHVVPELEATTHSLRVHTSQTGRVVAAGTIIQHTKTNETSNVEAENLVGFGEVTWLPLSYLSLTTKVRFQKNDSSTQSNSTLGLDYRDYNNNIVDYIVNPGVESETTTASLNVRYTLIPKTSLYGKYTSKVKDVDEQSSIDWKAAPKSTWDIYEIGLTNWLFPKVRTSARFVRTEIRTELDFSTINNNPEKSNLGNIGLTWMIKPELVAYAGANIVREDTETNRISGATTSHGNGEALKQQYQASLTYLIDEKLSVTPTYTYLSDEQGRDIVLDDVVDSGYTSKQDAHHVSMNLMYLPIEKLSINASLGYTDSSGSYYPTSPFTGSSGVIDTAQLAGFSDFNSQEINSRLDTEYNIGNGMAVGLILQHTDWKLSAADNPSEGTFYSGLLKLSYKIK